MYPSAVLPLWPDKAPGTETWSQQESALTVPFLNGPNIVRNVTQPTLAAYLPDPSIGNGTAVILYPGGGYHFLSMESEGSEVAHWLNRRGVAAFVVKYRLIPTSAQEETFLAQLRQMDSWDQGPMWAHQPIAEMDGQQAVRLVRTHAAEWRIDAQRIGVVGFSAGGAVAVGVATHYDAQSRPNFAAPIYSALWQELHVPTDAPPLFLLLAQDDPIIQDGSLPLYMAWKTVGVPVELHLYAKGGHGFGMKAQGLPTDSWIERFHEWLQMMGLLL